ncbi:MAG: hypothetical protein ACK4PI_00495 [Tepidisphaerales bacterium]
MDATPVPRPPLSPWSCLWVLPAGLCLLWILTRGVMVPYWDQFDIGRFLASAFERGYPSWSELFAQHNESRKFFPRLIFWLLAVPGHWDVRREMVAQWVVLLVAAALLTSLARRTMPPGPAAVVAAVGGTLLFSLSQWQNLLWGIQLVTVVPTCMLLVGIWALTAPGPAVSATRFGLRLGVAVAAAAVATFSYANGMALWVLLVPAVLLARAPSWRWRWGGLGVLLLAATAALLLYFTGYQRPAHHPAPDVALTSPRAAADFFLAFLGNALRVAADAELARTLGAVLLAAALLSALALSGSAVRGRTLQPLRDALPWLSLIAYAVLSAAATTAGRLGFGLQAAIAERYVTFALPLAIGVLPALYLAAKAACPRSPCLPVNVLTAATSAVLTLHLLATAYALRESRSFITDREQGLTVAIWLDAVPNGPEAEVLLYPVPNQAREILQRLHGLGKLPFPLARSDRASDYRPPSAPAPVAGAVTPPPLAGHVDLLRRDGTLLTLSGWAVAPGRPRRPADAVLLALDLPDGDARLLAMTARTRQPRPDVPANAGRHFTAECGWSLTLDLTHHPLPEDAMLSVWVYDRHAHTLHRLESQPLLLPPAASSPAQQPSPPPAPNAPGG